MNALMRDSLIEWYSTACTTSIKVETIMQIKLIIPKVPREHGAYLSDLPSGWVYKDVREGRSTGRGWL